MTEVEVWASNTLSSARLIENNGVGTLQEQYLHQCYSVTEILSKLQEVVQSINSNGLTEENFQVLNRLATESSFWHEDEFEVVPA